MPRIRSYFWATAAVAVLVTGCASAVPAGDAPAGDAEIVAEISCAGTDPLGADTGPRAGAIPGGFEPVAVVRCLPFQSVQDDDGIWSVVVQERLEGDLAPLLAAQSSPDDPPTSGACAAIMTVTPQVWLTDAGGRGIRVRYPADACGQPKVDLIDAALTTLEVAHTDEKQRVLTQPRAALDAGCEATWAAKPLQLATAEDLGASEAGGSPRPLPSGGAQDLPAPEITAIPWSPPSAPAPGQVDALTLCAYSTDWAAQPQPTPAPGATEWATVTFSGTAWFTGARQLDADETRTALDAIAHAERPATRCDEEPGALVVLDAGERFPPMTVELDGCRRLIVDHISTFAAPSGLVDLLAG